MTDVDIYPKKETNPTIENSDSSKANIGFCFSGGGSRALTCAWGQLLGLKALDLISSARYISSVSGGTWASAVYNYLPDHISDDELLGAYYSPENLSLTGGSGKMNVNELSEYSLGKAPLGMDIGVLLFSTGIFLLSHEKPDYKWLWAYIVGEFVLEPFGLRSEGSEAWESSKFFSLSENYAKKNFPESSPPLDDFFFLRQGRPFHIINDNIMEKVNVAGKEAPNIVQLPNQITPVSGGAQGQTPDNVIIGGGSVESYGYSSTLNQSSAISSPVDITIDKPYSLIDTVSTSSAFFADTIASLFKEHISDPDKRKVLINNIDSNLKSRQREILFSKADIEGVLLENFDLRGIIENILEDIVTDLSLDEIIPTYNYWPVCEESINKQTEYTDGGTLDNTGVLGMLAQTDTGSDTQDPIYLVVFDNTSTVLQKKNGNIVAASQVAPLFGIDFDDHTGSSQPFTQSQQNPELKEFKATSLTAIFDNNEVSPSNTPFSILVNGLYNASCGTPKGETPNDADVCTNPAFYEITLKTIENSLANVSAGRVVNMLYIQNAKILNWQNKIGDTDLKNQIIEGQNESINPFKSFKDFPYYSTAFKIGLLQKESNALSQMWAWALSDDQSTLKDKLQKFIENV